MTLIESIPTNPLDALALALTSLPASAPHPTDFAVGAGTSGGVGIAGSFSVNVITQTTIAYIGSGALINTLVGTAGYPMANADEGVTVSATETMTIRDWAGAIGGGNDVGVGAALDVNIVTESDQAYIDSERDRRRGPECRGHGQHKRELPVDHGGGLARRFGGDRRRRVDRGDLAADERADDDRVHRRPA